MKHKAEIQELLVEAGEYLALIDKAYCKARVAEDVVVIARPKVKTCLEHLRSSLDYAAHDLSETLGPATRPRKIYFPYGANQMLYVESLRRNLPGLDGKYLPLLESLQPHKCGSEWLVRLCQATNFNKHVRLQEQERKNSPEASTKLGNIVHMDAGSQVTIGKLFVNGRRVNPTGPLVLTGSKPVAEIERELAIPIPVVREYKWVKFVLAGTSVDVLELLQESHMKIAEFIREIYSA